MTATSDPIMAGPGEPNPFVRITPKDATTAPALALAAASSVAAGPRIPKREEWIDLPQDEYPGFKVRIWVNAPKRVVDDLTKGEDGARSTLTQIVTGHNGWVDYDGNEYPQPSDPAFWDAIPTELATVVIALYQEAVFRLPNAVMARGKR